VDTLQICTNYQPTEKEQNLLEVLINPENRMKSITDICKIAKCERQTYYNAFAKPGFVEIYNAKCQELIKQSVGAIINAFVREAQRGSYQHGKLLLDMAGLHTDEEKARTAALKAKVVDNGGDTEDDGFLAALSGKAGEVWQEE